MTSSDKCRLVFTEGALAEVGPAGWRHVSDFLQGLLARKPFADNSGPVSGIATGWDAERWILGTLASELSYLCREAGETIADAPMAFGSDPVARARAFVAEVNEQEAASARFRERDLAQALDRERRHT